MLARTIDARATRDIDLLSKEQSLEGALEALKAAASVDLGDHMRFVFESANEIKTEDEYRSGLSVVFTPWLGPKRMQPISIDLVVDEIPLEEAEVVTPADRIRVEGVEVCDYLVYPVESALADKLCAMIERHDGRPSSRVKDLVDVLVYATTCAVDGGKLTSSIKREAGARRLVLAESFAVPEGWEKAYGRQFAKLCAQTRLSDAYSSIAEAAKLAAKLLDPALRGEVEGLSWDPEGLEWG